MRFFIQQTPFMRLFLKQPYIHCVLICGRLLVIYTLIYEALVTCTLSRVQLYAAIKYVKYIRLLLISDYIFKRENIQQSVSKKNIPPLEIGNRSQQLFDVYIISRLLNGVYPLFCCFLMVIPTGIFCYIHRYLFVKLFVYTYGMELLTSSALLSTVFACELVTLHKHS